MIQALWYKYLAYFNPKWNEIWGYQIGNEKIDKRGDSPVFELEFWNLDQPSTRVIAEVGDALNCT